MTTPNLQLPEVPEAILTASDELNDGLWITDALLQLAVISRVVTYPPPGAVQGDRYIIPADSVDVWADRFGHIAYLSPFGWIYIVPRNGFFAWVTGEDPKVLLVYQDGIWTEFTGSGDGGPASGGLAYADVNAATSNTVLSLATETAFGSAYVIPLDNLVSGSIIRGELFGTYGTDASAPTLRLRIKLNATTVLDTTAFTATGSLVGRGWHVRFTIGVTTPGTSGEVEAQGVATFSTGTTTAAVVHMPNTAKVSVDIDSPTSLGVTVQWGTADPDNTITLREMIVEVDNAAYLPPQIIIALLHFDGVDASTAIVDQYPNTWTAGGSAQIDDAQFKFGLTSLRLPGGAGDWVDLNSPGFTFSTGDFTIECFVRFTSRSGNNFIFSFGAGWGVYTFSGTWAVFDGVSTNVLQGGSSSDNTWIHIALVRRSGVLAMYAAGNQINTPVVNTTNHTVTALRIGAQTVGTGLMNGHVDEFRVSNVAQYVTNFTPPAAPFADP